VTLRLGRGDEVGSLFSCGCPLHTPCTQNSRNHRRAGASKLLGYMCVLNFEKGRVVERLFTTGKVGEGLYVKET